MGPFARPKTVLGSARPEWLSRWVLLSLGVGAVILAVRLQWSTAVLSRRLVRDTVLFIAVPLGLGLSYGRSIGWTINRQAIINTLVLSAFVTPFYVVGSTLPTIRTFYPMWPTSTALADFLPHSLMLLLLALATETYYRGLLCVGVREIGVKSVFISPVVYALMHTGKPPIELALSGPTDVLFGAVDYHCGSILPSVVAHGFGLVLLDWLVLNDPLWDPAVTVAALEWLPLPV